MAIIPRLRNTQPSPGTTHGSKGGVITWIEKNLDRKLHWLICQINTNELMLRKLIEVLDGKTDSKTGFSNPLGKMLMKVNTMKPNFNFEPINIGPDLIVLPADIVKDLSTDQNLLYLLCKAVRTGYLPPDVAQRKPGAIVHSRWLTTAETFLKLYMSEIDLDEELKDRLKIIVTFIVSDYAPMWFQLKVKNS